jgi:hypothetical protein
MSKQSQPQNPSIEVKSRQQRAYIIDSGGLIVLEQIAGRASVSQVN